MTKLAVVISWPYDQTPWAFWASLWNSDIRFEKDVTILRPVCPMPEIGGNMAVKVALDMGCDEVLFLDVDQDVPGQVLEKFRAHKKDVVGALTALRSYPHVWSMFNFSPSGDGRRVNVKPTQPLQKVDVTGCGCMLVNMDVFKHVEPPWFKTEISADGCDVLKSSDFYFFEKVKATGYELYIDTTVESTHHTDLALNSYSLGRKIDYIEIHSPAEEKEESCVHA